MKLKFLIFSALSNIAVRKIRSFLTILGIMIGVAAIIAVMSIGEGATDLIMGEIDQMGANTIVVSPGDMESGFTDLFFRELLTSDDLESLRDKANVPNAEKVAPVAVVPRKLSYQGKTYKDGTIIGTDAAFFTETYDMKLDEGINFSDLDIENKEKLAIIGSKVEEDLFESKEVLGEKIDVGGNRFRVAGVYKPRGNIGPLDMDTVVIIPYTTVQTYITGEDEFDEFYVRVDNASNVDRSAFDIKMTLRETRGINEGEDDDFMVMTQEGMMDLVDNIMNVLNTFLVFMVSISLLVGGIGIMNIMLVSVTERTREIGLRKALGATPSAILKQFVWEAITLTVLGGFFGIVIGVVISLLASVLLTELLAVSWAFSFPFQAALLGIGISAAVGLMFGLYPAWKAAKKDPIEALQYEK
ncbi:MAG: ABC transporter permease [Candidatus Paceibacterota bacterium]